MPENLVLEVLREIRDQMVGMRGDITATNQCLDRTNERLDRTNERLDRVVQEQIRHATAIVDLEKGQREILAAIVKMNADISGRLDNILTGPMGTMLRNHEDRISALERRTG
jgi:small-conductance mechanosensitive channel